MPRYAPSFYLSIALNFVRFGSVGNLDKTAARFLFLSALFCAAVADLVTALLAVMLLAAFWDVESVQV